ADGRLDFERHVTDTYHARRAELGFDDLHLVEEGAVLAAQIAHGDLALLEDDRAVKLRHELGAHLQIAGVVVADAQLATGVTLRLAERARRDDQDGPGPAAGIGARERLGTAGGVLGAFGAQRVLADRRWAAVERGLVAVDDERDAVAGHFEHAAHVEQAQL